LEFLKKFKFNFYLPLALDGSKPSMTLLSAWVSFFVAEYAILKNIDHEPTRTSSMVAAVGLFIFCMIMLRLRRLDNAELDLDDFSIKLNSKGKDEKSNKEDLGNGKAE